MSLFSRLTLLCALFSIAAASEVPEVPYTGNFASGQYSVSWTHSVITDLLTFTVTTPINSWSEVGFSNKENSGHDGVDSILCFAVEGQGILLPGNSIPGTKDRHRKDKAPQATLVSLNTVGQTQTCIFTRPRLGDNIEDVSLIIPERGLLAIQYLVWAWGTNTPDGCTEGESVCLEGNVELKDEFPYRYANHGAINRGSKLVRFFDPALQPTEEPVEPAEEDMGMMMGIIGGGAAIVLGSAAYFVTGNKKPKEMSRMQFARASMGFGGGGRGASQFGPGFGAAPGAVQGGSFAGMPPPGMGMAGGSFGSFSEPPISPPPKPPGLFARASALIGGVGGRAQSFGHIAMNRLSMAPQAFGFRGGNGGMHGNQGGLDKQPSMFKSPNGGGGVWKTTVDPTTGVSYYYNKAQNRSTWNKPMGVAGL